MNALLGTIKEALTKKTNEDKWKPKKGDTYFYADPYAYEFCSWETWMGNDSDKRRYKKKIIRKRRLTACETGHKLYLELIYKSMKNTLIQAWEDEQK
jgi:hypothetical protein